MVRAKLTTTCTKVIDAFHSIRFTVIPVSQIRDYMWKKLDTIQMAK